jgi:hypothetical protein
MTDQPLRVYVGTETEQLLTFQVLAYTIRRTARGPVEVLPLSEAIAGAGIRIPAPRSSRTRQYTPFSFQRFAIPQLCGYKGKAVYLDSDMMVFRDIHELPTYAAPGSDAAAAQEPPGSGRRSQISVMVLDCERLDWDVARIVEDLEKGTYTYRQLYGELPIAKAFSRSLPHRWNDLERYTPGTTCLTHFTDMETQPWLYAPHALGAVWCRALFDALEAGAVAKEFIFDQVMRGWLRPSLAYQIEHDIVNPAKLPERILHVDAYAFTPPHRVGILPKRWLHRLACALTDYGKVRPSPGARLMRSFQAVGYQAYRHIRGKRLLAH